MAIERASDRFTDQIRDQLAAPFEPAQVGKLAKARSGKDFPRCNLCGSRHEFPNNVHVHVDYVGHALVTYRLNQVVGPGNWSYVIDEWKERDGHLIAVVGTMTVLGRTIGQEIGTPQRSGAWGDEAKTAISDFVSRAAMRFGVALDLWSKQDLETSPIPGDPTPAGAGARAERSDRGAGPPAPAGSIPAGAPGGASSVAPPAAPGAPGAPAGPTPERTIDDLKDLCDRKHTHLGVLLVKVRKAARNGELPDAMKTLTDFKELNGKGIAAVLAWAEPPDDPADLADLVHPEGRAS